MHHGTLHGHFGHVGTDLVPDHQNVCNTEAVREGIDTASFLLVCRPVHFHQSFVHISIAAHIKLRTNLFPRFAILVLQM